MIRPLPGLPVVRDLIVDMTQFYDNYAKVKPFLIADDALPFKRELAIPRRTGAFGWSVRVYYVRLLYHFLPFILVESG